MIRNLFSRVIPFLASVALFAACSQAPTSPDASKSNSKGGKSAADGTAPAQLSIQLGKVGVLSKTSSITVKKLVLAAVTSGEKPDTIRDTSLVEGNNQVNLSRILKLKPKTWTLFAKTLDAQDSVVHFGSTEPFMVRLADTALVTLILQSRFTMYRAVFKDLPISIDFSGENGDRGDKVGVAITRLSMTVDGAIKADSTAKEFFGPDREVVLKWDYVLVGSHEITLKAYGQTGTYKGLLYTGSVTVSLVPGQDETKPVIMSWVGPSTGAGRSTIIVGRVGQLDLKPIFPEKFQ